MRRLRAVFARLDGALHVEERAETSATREEVRLDRCARLARHKAEVVRDELGLDLGARHADTSSRSLFTMSGMRDFTVPTGTRRTSATSSYDMPAARSR